MAWSTHVTTDDQQRSHHPDDQPEDWNYNFYIVIPFNTPGQASSGGAMAIALVFP